MSSLTISPVANHPSQLHDRQPVVLEGASLAAWIDITVPANKVG